MAGQECPYHSASRVTPSVHSTASATSSSGTEPQTAWLAASGLVLATQNPPGALRFARTCSTL